MGLGIYTFFNKCWRIKLFENLSLENFKFENYVQTFLEYVSRKIERETE